MGSLRFEGILFAIYSHDHAPPHAHARYGETRLIVLLNDDKKFIEAADRKDAIDPWNAKRSDIRKIVESAREHADELMALWRETHE